jgi:hypothetical protein
MINIRRSVSTLLFKMNSLIQHEDIIEELNNLKLYIINYYKILFGAFEEDNFSIDES